MSLKGALSAELEKKRKAEVEATSAHDAAHAELKAWFHEIVGDKDFRQSLYAEIELNGDELQIDPGPILIRATVDKAGKFGLSYEIKDHDDPVTKMVEVSSIADIEQAVARLLVEYRD